MSSDTPVIREPTIRTTGSDHFLLKPIKQDELSQAIYTQLQRSLTGLHLLVVDDNADTTSLVETRLTPFGVNVEKAHSGQEAVSMSSTTKFDMVLMDTQMPVMDGLQATKIIREGAGPNSNVPIFSFSAGDSSSAGNTFDPETVGMNGRLNKPLLKGDLIAAVVKLRGEGRL